jgi:hypothetical protein
MALAFRVFQKLIFYLRPYFYDSYSNQFVNNTRVFCKNLYFLISSDIIGRLGNSINIKNNYFNNINYIETFKQL